jgi:hypothetical protein
MQKARKTAGEGLTARTRLNTFLSPDRLLRAAATLVGAGERFAEGCGIAMCVKERHINPYMSGANIRCRRLSEVGEIPQRNKRLASAGRFIWCCPRTLQRNFGRSGRFLIVGYDADIILRSER